MNRSYQGHGTKVAALAVLLVASAACSSSQGGFPHGVPVDDSGAATREGGGTGSDSANDAGTATDSAAVEGAVDASSSANTGADVGTVATSWDAFAASRTACVDEINRLRATQSLAPYTLIDNESVDLCVDGQATSDEAADSAHKAWLSGADSCNGNAQDECEGYGTDRAGIVACLDAMWNEQKQPNCTGCVGCNAFGGACPGCDYYGMRGPECGHYVNMSASYFSMVACGFSASPGTWSAQNFQ